MTKKTTLSPEGGEELFAKASPGQSPAFGCDPYRSPAPAPQARRSLSFLQEVSASCSESKFNGPQKSD